MQMNRLSRYFWTSAITFQISLLMDDNHNHDEEEFLMVQNMLEEMRQPYEEVDLELDLMAAAALVVYGLKEARRLCADRWRERRLYLVCRDLLPNPRQQTLWQALFNSQNDRAFITTMGFDIAAFNLVL